MSPQVLTARFIADLSRLLRTPSVGLRDLQGRWPGIARSLRQERKKVLARIPPDDPIKDKTDLLSPLNSDVGEVLHTLALAYLLSPLESHGFRSAPLEQFLAVVRGMPESEGLALPRLLKALRSPRTKVTVTPERRHILADPTSRKVPRTDIWIEIQGRAGTRLIVIENKIRALEQHQQLDQYAARATDWCKRHAHGSKPVLVFLTRVDGRKPTSDRWIAVSYAHLANVLRGILRKNKSATGAPWLRLYVASLARGVLGLRIRGNRPLDLRTLRRYLGEPTR